MSSHVSPTFRENPRAFMSSVLAGVGVGPGDVGTSFIYVFPLAAHYVDFSQSANVIGFTSLVVWSLILGTILYLGFMMEVDDHGEGGSTALMSLLRRSGVAYVFTGYKWWIPKGFWKLIHNPRTFRAICLSLVGMTAVGTILGDGCVTPVMSVLSASEGLKIFLPDLSQIIIDVVAFSILTTLFIFQHKGTQKIGVVFGPFMIVWFLTLGCFGLLAIFKHADIVWALLNPKNGLDFLLSKPIIGGPLTIVVLSITGLEAFYADMKHIGKNQFRAGWTFVLPCLICAYLGGGALILVNPDNATHIIYALLPIGFAWYIFMFLLSNGATVVASQALLTGVMSITKKSIELNNFPSLEITVPDRRYPDQIYIPTVNKILWFTCTVLIVLFRSTENLANAYGITVLFSMTLDNIQFGVVAVIVKGWLKRYVVPGVGFATVILVTFIVANSPKIPEGGLFPLTIAIGVAWFMVVRNLRSEAKLSFRRGEISELDVRRWSKTCFSGTAMAIGLLDGHVHEATVRQIDYLNFLKKLDVPYIMAHVTSSIHRQDMLLSHLQKSVMPYVDVSPSHYQIEEGCVKFRQYDCSDTSLVTFIDSDGDSIARHAVKFVRQFRDNFQGTIFVVMAKTVTEEGVMTGTDHQNGARIVDYLRMLPDVVIVEAHNNVLLKTLPYSNGHKTVYDQDLVTEMNNSSIVM